jgi:hypothetical protein
VSLVFFSPVPLGFVTHGCGLFPLLLPKTRHHGAERILIPDGRPKRAPRKPRTYPLARRRSGA